jgi:MOSC domain-containing protein YiiM
MNDRISSGTLTAIFVKRAHGGPMDAVMSGQLVTGKGLAGNADFGGRRQVTIITEERWRELMNHVGANLGPQSRRANLVVSGIDLMDTRGRTLKIGSSTLRINGETRPCEQMEEAASGLQAAMRDRWGGGAYAEIVEGGPIVVGDAVSWDL